MNSFAAFPKSVGWHRRQKSGASKLSFESVDALQKTLADTVFHCASDRRKAAGRALGTLIEIVTFYTLRAWDLRDHIVIERSVPEFGNPEIAHNVEFSLHPIRARHQVRIEPLTFPLTAAKIRAHMPLLRSINVRSTQVLSRDHVLRNATVIAENDAGPIVANVDALKESSGDLTVCELFVNPFAIFECKRVGVEEGMRKGPQTIEKAKQGAYVARSVSALQKVRLRNGSFQGVIECADGAFRRGSYDDLLRQAIDDSPANDLAGFTLTVGVVSNHGNWFTSENHNKELRVLAQSYDWLLFLTDAGLSQFIDNLLLKPAPELVPAREAFLASYSGKSGANKFTKVRMALSADEALRSYFMKDGEDVETWFNVIAPRNGTFETLQADLRKLAAKAW
jgi:hypothetical protein